MAGTGLVVGSLRKRRGNKKGGKPWYSKKYSIGDIASKAWSGVKYIKELINVETHTVDVAQSGGLIDYNGTVLLLNQVAQGDTRVNRQGKSIKGKYLSGRGKVSLNGGTNNTVRLMIVQDTMNQGTAPSVSDILETTGASYAPYANIKQLANGRFKVLWTRLFNVNTVSTYSQLFKYYIKLNSHQFYDGANATDAQKNALYFVQISDAVTSNLPGVDVYNRYAFYDN